MADIKGKPFLDIQTSVANKAGRVTTRRGFLKTAIVTGLAMGTTALAAKKVGGRLLKEDFARQVGTEERMAMEALKGKRLVMMSEAEKEEMIKAFEADAK